MYIQRPKAIKNAKKCVRADVVRVFPFCVGNRTTNKQYSNYIPITELDLITNLLTKSIRISNNRPKRFRTTRLMNRKNCVIAYFASVSIYIYHRTQMIITQVLASDPTKFIRICRLSYSSFYYIFAYINIWLFHILTLDQCI